MRQLFIMSKSKQEESQFMKAQLTKRAKNCAGTSILSIFLVRIILYNAYNTLHRLFVFCFIECVMTPCGVCKAQRRRKIRAYLQYVGVIMKGFVCYVGLCYCSYRGVGRVYLHELLSNRVIANFYTKLHALGWNNFARTTDRNILSRIRGTITYLHGFM